MSWWLSKCLDSIWVFEYIVYVQRFVSFFQNFEVSVFLNMLSKYSPMTLLISLVPTVMSPFKSNFIKLGYIFLLVGLAKDWIPFSFHRFFVIFPLSFFPQSLPWALLLLYTESGFGLFLFPKAWGVVSFARSLCLWWSHHDCKVPYQLPLLCPKLMVSCAFVFIWL